MVSPWTLRNLPQFATPSRAHLLHYRLAPGRGKALGEDAGSGNRAASCRQLHCPLRQALHQAEQAGPLLCPHLQPGKIMSLA